MGVQSTTSIIRCLNIDWLECYCLEDLLGWPHNADYFREQGFMVVERPYGTRIYSEMFTIYDEDGQPFIEVRRDPCANHVVGAKSVIPTNAAHIRLSNRTCYFHSCADIMLHFLDSYGFAYQRISRIDLCLDFKRFDYGDDVQKFIDRYMNGRYAKINQSKIRAYGTDEWDGRKWNSLSWGSPSSQVSTKLYCKSLELREAKDKPYIRQAWYAAGLVHDFRTLAWLNPDGTTSYPDIWRLEFSIKSSVHNWMVLEDWRFAKKNLQSIRNDLSVYSTDQSKLDIFASLVDHYFHFKIFEKEKVKYKCKDKLLFNFNTQSLFYDVERPCNATPASTTVERLRKRLEEYMLHVWRPELRKACETVLEALKEEQIREAAVKPFDKNELTLLRQMIARRVNHSPNETVSETREHIKAMLALERDLFQEK